jgi:DnaJ-class molecular chaperone
VKNKRNYYRILYVQPDAPTALIRASYQTLMQKLRQHPDLGGRHWNASIINEAYRVLVDPEKRDAYDRVLFGKNDHATLGRQHPRQRETGNAPGGDDDGWRPFRPKVVS